ncbi:MAG: RidA family protein [Dehalococcoidia bacterium]
MGDLLFLSGQVALDANFQPLAQGDVAAQTRYAFESIQRIVSEAGGTLNDIV